VTFPWSYYLAAVLGSLITSAFALPLWRTWCLRRGLVDDPGHRKIHDAPVPLAGGLAVMTGLALPLLVGGLIFWWQRRDPGGHDPGAAAPELTSAYLLGYGLHRRLLELGGIVLGGIGMLGVGLLDDVYELRAGLKFGGQLLIAMVVAASGARISLFVPSLAFHYAITVLWILTLINAFNFMDNMNGLCAGLGAIGALFFASLAATAGQYLVALLAFLTFGALLGFLPFNFPRARCFLGDSGSHLVGYLMAVLAILPHFYTSKHPHHWAVLAPLLVLAVPLADLVWVVLHRSRRGQPFWIGDTTHLSHRLVRLGLTRTSAVVVIWMVATVIGSAVFLL
jgi:UDP-GlcNAc:undecaprenyl-phosphate GlcNAc-1-phosphate transferase